MSKIHEAICAVMADVGAVGKTERNETQKYKYRGIDAVMNALNPAMQKNRVFVAPVVLDAQREERTNSKGTLLIYSTVKVAYHFYADDGSEVIAVVMGEGMDSGDKSMNKAMSAAFKYACFQTFCIPTEEMLDSEKDSPEPLAKEAVKAAEEKTLLLKHINANWTKERIEKACEYYKISSPNELDPKQVRTILNDLKKKGELK